ncbi:MAG: ABC transporter permease, partial [Chloroflexi bacterium]|nr:ABC transporter permease [Chloroflexota bacterium]
MSDTTLVSAPRGRIARLRARLPRLPWVPLIIIGAIVFATIFAPLLTPHEPDAIQMQMRFQPPAWAEKGLSEFPLGTDTLGRDLLTRILFGARVSLLVAIIVLAISGTFGLVLGIVAGYLKGKVGVLIMRLVDSLMAVPALLLALVFAMTLGPSMKTVVIALSVVNWARYARVIRGEVLVHAGSAYVMQAKVAGASSLRIMLVHILPNVVNTFVILLSLNVGNIILTEAALSFLG